MSGPRFRAIVALVAAVAAGMGCASSAPPPVLAVRPAPSREAMFDAVLRRFAGVYIDPAAIDPSVMLAGAVSELVANVPELDSQTRDGVIYLALDGRRAALSLEVSDLDELSAALDAASDWVESAAIGAEPLALRTTALRGAVRAVDRWGNVLHGRRRDAFMSRFRGSMVGVGCRIGRRGGAVRILEVYRGSAAARAGLRKGDPFLAIDGVSVEDETVSQVMERLRGRVGERVVVRTRRAPREPDVDVVVTRSQFMVPTVSSRIVRADVGYLKISHIAKNSGVVAERVLGGLRELSSLKGIVLDLRRNSGGSLLAAGRIADQFIDDGVLIETRGRGGRPVRSLRHRIDATRRDPPLLPTTLVVLVDSGTASSAEFLAAALVGHDRAILVGRQTFGKGVLQKTYSIGAGKIAGVRSGAPRSGAAAMAADNEVLLKVTVARAYAGGGVIPEGGLVPDVVVEPGDAGAPSVACADAALSTGAKDAERPMIAVTLAGQADGVVDPWLSFAVDLIQRYPALSRAELLDSIRRDYCSRA